jgi:hypothetical protein
MRAKILACPAPIVAFGLLAFASSLAAAQTGQDPNMPAAKSDAKPSAGSKPATSSVKKAKSGSDTAKASDTDKKPKPGQYASEAEARSHCQGTIVWVDQDHFNHYAGSREYGRKPGAFACEN